MSAGGRACSDHRPPLGWGLRLRRQARTPPGGWGAAAGAVPGPTGQRPPETGSGRPPEDGPGCTPPALGPAPAPPSEFRSQAAAESPKLVISKERRGLRFSTQDVGWERRRLWRGLRGGGVQPVNASCASAAPQTPCTDRLPCLTLRPAATLSSSLMKTGTGASGSLRSGRGRRRPGGTFP